jgi:hypothetical protein
MTRAVMIVYAPEVRCRHRPGRHLTHKAVAKCKWPKAEWVIGDGPYATVSYCSVTTVMLHEDGLKAWGALDMIDSTGCGHACRGDHRLVLIGGVVTDQGGVTP